MFGYFAKPLLNNVLDETRAFKSTTPTYDQPSPTTTASCPPDHIHSSVSNLSLNSTVSPDTSTDTDSSKSLSTVAAIVAKYLSPTQSSTSKTTKRVIKRSYGVSVTDLDVFSENFMKQQKKKGQKVVKKKATDDDDNEISEKRPKKAKTLPKTTKTSSNADGSQILYTTNDYPSQFSHHDPNTLHFLSSLSFPNPMCRLYPPQSTSDVLQQLQNVSTSTSSICGCCYQQLNTLKIGGYCVQCGVPIGWLCWSSELYNAYYCNNCRSFNRTQ